MEKRSKDKKVTINEVECFCFTEYSITEYSIGGADFKVSHSFLETYSAFAF